MVQDIDIVVDLTAAISLKKSLPCSSGLSPLNTFKNINITEALKHFQYGKLKKKIEVY